MRGRGQNADLASGKCMVRVALCAAACFSCNIWTCASSSCSDRMHARVRETHAVSHTCVRICTSARACV